MSDYFVYILASRSRTLYTGVTNDLLERVWQHRAGQARSFTTKYKIRRLVFYECTSDPRVAIAREKQIQGWTRAKSIALIESMNPTWDDLSEPWLGKADSSHVSRVGA